MVPLADEADRQAILHRYDLIIESDFRALARQSRVPVYYLAGGVDPIVPWVFVWPWLKRHCAGYRAGRVFWGADHAILSGAATRAARTRTAQRRCRASWCRRWPAARQPADPA